MALNSGRRVRASVFSVALRSLALSQRALCRGSSWKSGSGGDAPCEPRLNLLLDPPNGVLRDLDPHREMTCRLKFVDLGSSKSRHIYHLREPQQSNGSTCAGRDGRYRRTRVHTTGAKRCRSG